MPAEVRGGRLLPSGTGSVWTVRNDYIGPRRAQPWQLWFFEVERLQCSLPDPSKSVKPGGRWPRTCLFLLPTANASVGVGAVLGIVRCLASSLASNL